MSDRGRADRLPLRSEVPVGSLLREPPVGQEARTPKPPRPSGGPRPVQAPKRRTGPSRTASAPSGPGPRTAGLWPLAAVAVALIIVGVALGVVPTRSSSEPQNLALDGRSTGQDLPGLQTGPPPWSANGQPLSRGSRALEPERAQPGGARSSTITSTSTSTSTASTSTFRPSSATAAIASTHKFNFITDTTRTGGGRYIHVESPPEPPYVLGQFFGAWGVKLTRTCLGGFDCGNLKVWVNGKPHLGDPELLPLKKHQEIVVASASRRRRSRRRTTSRRHRRSAVRRH